MTTKTAPAKSNVDTVTELALEWIDANRDKNDANNRERKLAERLKKEVATGSRTIDIDDKTELLVGFIDTQSEEIDPRLLFKKNPELFWELCSVAKGAVEAALGEKEVAKLSRTVTKNDFKVKKIKKK